MSHAYALWKTVHVLSATILLGTWLGTAFFCWLGYRSALRSSDIGALRTVLRLTVIADYCLTAPAAVVQAASGLVLMSLLGWPWMSPWSAAVYGLFMLAGACWLPVVWLQIRFERDAERAPSIASLPVRFHNWFRWWFALGVVAFAAVIAIFYPMVVKPIPAISEEVSRLKRKPAA
jgi:uncharacterized membrane protein